MRIKFPCFAGLALALSLLSLTVALLGFSIFLLPAHAQVEELPQTLLDARCQLLNPPYVFLYCTACPSGEQDPTVELCQYQMPDGFRHGVCTVCSGCSGKVCQYYLHFNCGRRYFCVSGIFTGDCNNYTAIQVCM